MLLAGDIGGTKTTLAVYLQERGPYHPLEAMTFSSKKYPSLEAIIRDYLASTNLKVDRASFGVAGPVVDGQVQATNLPWQIDESRLKERLNLDTVSLINDLAAIAQGLPWLQSKDLRTLSAGQPADKGTRAVIAPGTGLGEAFLTWDGTRYQAHASEGGHVDFAPRDRHQQNLLNFCRERYNHVSYERVCSGMGLPNIYAYVKESGLAGESKELALTLSSVEDPTPTIVQHALANDCPLCVATMEIFVSILGAETGNLALKVLATGGVYLGGGIPPRILPLLDSECFLEAFFNKGRLKHLTSQIPVHVILNPRVALLGAACHGLEHQDTGHHTGKRKGTTG